MTGTSAGEFRKSWLAIIACAVGVGVGLTGLPFYTFGVFVNPLEEAFGWSRSEIMTGLLIVNGGTVFLSPLLGVLMDRFGVRVIAIPALIGLAAGFFALSFSGPGILSFYLGWVVLAILASGTTPLSWTRAISERFDQARGLALGLTLLGTGVASALGPSLVQYAISSGGWQAGYRAMGLFVLIVALPLALIGLRGTTKPKTEETSGEATPLKEGFTFGQAVTKPAFWLIISGICFVIFAQASSTVHFIPLLRSRGISAETAAGIMGALGISVIIGRIVVGYLLDRFHAPKVARVFLMVPALSLLLLLTRDDLASAWLAAILLGLAAGAEVDLLAYLVGRYFGLRSYGLIYGVALSGFAVGGGLGPMVTGMIYEANNGYQTALIGGIVIFAIGAGLIGCLGKYPDFARQAKT